MDSKTGRRRPRMEYMSQIIKDMGMENYLNLKEQNSIREAWRAAANQSND